MKRTFNRDTGHGGAISLATYDDGSLMIEIDRQGLNYAALTTDCLYALVDWASKNIPRSKPTPLPTQFGAVIESNGEKYALVDGCWFDESGRGTNTYAIERQGFDVIFEGAQ